MELQQTPTGCSSIRLVDRARRSAGHDLPPNSHPGQVDVVAPTTLRGPHRAPRSPALSYAPTESSSSAWVTSDRESLNIVFDIEDREALREQIVERARDDASITACAVLGSAARGEEDAWSDVDIALQVSERAGLNDVATEWTAWLKSYVDVADTLDVHGSGALYRVPTQRLTTSRSLLLAPCGVPVDRPADAPRLRRGRAI